jgi:hypothetical protein
MGFAPGSVGINPHHGQGAAHHSHGRAFKKIATVYFTFILSHFFLLVVLI